ncbi:ECF-type sigma factor [Aliikangiella sp. IMCC44359]|uniref:ECF-type sigma factor n=1 Tax=Aliikangiella sp. IMCC44359 TaxID=3459125 RepID=UPI00403A962D
MKNNQSNLQVTQLLNNWRKGEALALEQLTPIVNDELHRLASQYMQKEANNHTLQATALVNEAFIKLIGSDIDWKNKLHFMAMASRIMRNILVDHAKAKNTIKRQTNKNALSFDESLCTPQSDLENIVMLDQLLNQLEKFDVRASKMLELTLFGGLTNNEVADAMQVSLSTVEREIRIAKAWLNNQR